MLKLTSKPQSSEALTKKIAEKQRAMHELRSQRDEFLEAAYGEDPNAQKDLNDLDQRIGRLQTEAADLQTLKRRAEAREDEERKAEASRQAEARRKARAQAVKKLAVRAKDVDEKFALLVRSIEAMGAETQLYMNEFAGDDERHAHAVARVVGTSEKHPSKTLTAAACFHGLSRYIELPYSSPAGVISLAQMLDHTENAVAPESSPE